MKDKQREKEGLMYIRSNFDHFLDNLLDMVMIEAPTGYEQKRAEKMCEAFQLYGLHEVCIDEHGNAIGIRRGRCRDRYILLEAHMDTVFPFGTVSEIPKIIDGKIFCPGIGDNTAGLAEILMVLETLQELSIETEYSLLFAGTVCEEGRGSLRGIKGILSDYGKQITQVITVDGFQYEDIVYNATGIVTKKITLQGQGGHSAEQGIAPQAILTGAEMVNQIKNIDLPLESGATLAVTMFSSGNEENPHTIPETADVIVNYRCRSSLDLQRIDEQLLRLVWEICNRAEILYNIETLCDIPAGTQSREVGIVRALAEVIRDLGGEARYAEGGCTNANAAIHAGIPAVAVGSSNIDYREHTLQEYMEVEKARICIEEIYLLILRLSAPWRRNR